MIRGWVERVVSKLVPRDWRETVEADLDDEARAGERGRAWRHTEILRAGFRLRLQVHRDAWITDGRGAIRSVWRSGRFTTTAVVTFALAIGVNLAVLSVVDRMLFRQLPYAEPHRLVQIHTTSAAASAPYLMIAGVLESALHDHPELVESMTAIGGGGAPLTIPDLGEAPLRGAGVTRNLLSVLGVRPLVGRDFEADDHSNRETELLVSWETWRNRFGGASEAIGQVFGTGTNVYRIIGVLPRGFVLPSPRLSGRVDALWLGADGGRGSRNQVMDAPIVRLRHGVTVDQARAQLAVITAQLAQADPSLRRGGDTFTAQVNPLHSSLFLLHRPYLWLTVTCVAMVLLLASVNLTVLWLVRLQSRRREVAVRAALGASRLRLARTLILECLLVCFCGALVAAIVCRLTQQAILGIVPLAFQEFSVAVFHLRLIGFALLLTIVGAAIASAVPAWQLSRSTVSALLAQRERRTGGGTLRGGGALLAIEAALALVLVAGAVSTVRSFAGLVLNHQGFVAEDLYVLSTSAGWQNRWPIKESWRDERAPAMLGIARTLPGVVSAAVATGLPTEGNSGSYSFWRARNKDGREFGITGGYFETLGTIVLNGRVISDADVAGVANVAVLSQAGAHALWPGQGTDTAVGRSFAYLDGTTKTVIGVVADFNRRPGEAPDPLLFLPFGTRALGAGSSNLYVPLRMRSGLRPDGAEINARIRREWGPDGASVRYVPDTLTPWLHQPRFQAAVFAVFAFIALIVAAVGLFAVSSFEASRRKFEMSVRVALGATGRDVGRVVLRSAVFPVLIGTAAGLLVAWWAARFIQRFLFEVGARDPWMLLVVAGVLALTATSAAWRPARRAARSDPAAVLKST